MMPKKATKKIKEKTDQALEQRFIAMGITPEYWKVCKDSYSLDDEPFYQNMLRMLTPDETGAPTITVAQITNASEYCLKSGYKTIRDIMKYIMGGLTAPPGAVVVTDNESTVMGELRRHEVSTPQASGVADPQGGGVVLNARIERFFKK